MNAPKPGTRCQCRDAYVGSEHGHGHTSGYNGQCVNDASRIVTVWPTTQSYDLPSQGYPTALCEPCATFAERGSK